MILAHFMQSKAKWSTNRKRAVNIEQISLKKHQIQLEMIFLIFPLYYENSLLVFQKYFLLNKKEKFSK